MSIMAVTGAASGIGAACVERLTEAGHEVVGIDQRDVEVVADLSTAEGRQTAIDEVGKRADGRLDGLVTCAGLAGFPDRAGSLVVSVNHFGTVSLLAGLRPLLAATPGSAAVAISSNSTTCQPEIPMAVVDACMDDDEERARSLADEVGSMAAYPASKIAVARWVRRQATTAEWAGADIRLNAVAPGLTETPLVAEGRADPRVAPLLDMFPLPLGRPGRAEEVAALVAFLLGPESTYFCGSLVFADGGSDALLRPDDWPAPWDLKMTEMAKLL